MQGQLLSKQCLWANETIKLDMSISEISSGKHVRLNLAGHMKYIYIYCPVHVLCGFPGGGKQLPTIPQIYWAGL